MRSDSSRGKNSQDMSLVGPFQTQTSRMHYSHPILFSLILVFSHFSHGSMFLTGMSSCWYYEIAEIWFGPLSWDLPSLLRQGVRVRIHLYFPKNGVRVRGTKLEPCKAKKSCFIYLFLFFIILQLFGVCVCIHATACAWQKMNCRIKLCIPIMWDPQPELRFPGLAASVFTGWATFPILICLLTLKVKFYLVLYLPVGNRDCNGGSAVSCTVYVLCTWTQSLNSACSFLSCVPVRDKDSG